MTGCDHVGTLYDAVVIEHEATLTPEMRVSPAAVLVLTLAASIDAAREPSAVSTLSKEFRAASDALREAVLRAGKRGDAVDDLAKQRAARRGAGAADHGRAGQRGKQRPGGG